MKWKQKIKTAVWAALGLGCVVLLFAATKKKDALPCKKISIELSGENENPFVKKSAIFAALKGKGIAEGNAINEMNIKDAEDALNKNPWIKNAELYINNKQQLTVRIEERQPVARVFTVDGTSFYIDSSGLRLPASDAVARVTVFTSFPSSKKKLSVPDSLTLNDVKHIASFIAADSFWNAQVSQINITSQRTYEMIPVIGDQVIVIGDADSLKKKFDKLFIFYKNVWSKIGFEKYSKIDISFDNQIVAVRRGEALPDMDTSSAVNRMMRTDNGRNNLMNDTNYSAPVKIDSAAKKSATDKSAAALSSKPKSSSALQSNKSTNQKSDIQKSNSKNTTPSPKTKNITDKNTKASKPQPSAPLKKTGKDKPKAVMKKPPG